MEYKRTKTHLSNDYEVDTLGNVYSMKFGNEKKVKAFGKDYKCVSIMAGKRYTVPVHRLVAMAFIPNPQNKTDVNHINANKADNRVENLEWNTRGENMKHAYENGLIDNKGQLSAKSKLTNDDVIKIYNLKHSGVKQTKIAELFDISNTQVSAIVNGNQWGHLYQEWVKSDQKKTK